MERDDSVIVKNRSPRPSHRVPCEIGYVDSEGRKPFTLLELGIVLELVTSTQCESMTTSIQIRTNCLKDHLQRTDAPQSSSPWSKVTLSKSIVGATPSKHIYHSALPPLPFHFLLSLFTPTESFLTPSQNCMAESLVVFESIINPSEVAPDTLLLSLMMEV